MLGRPSWATSLGPLREPHACLTDAISLALLANARPRLRIARVKGGCRVIEA